MVMFENCGDCKCLVNKVSKFDKCPIPKTEALLATFRGREKLTKYDMFEVYQ